MARSVLADIAARKRKDLAARLDGVSLDAFRARAVPTERSLAKAIAQLGARFILEFKKASPSQGAIRGGADPAAVAAAYSGVADAMSVLCDEPYFGGSLNDLAAARSAFAGPILAKDFFIDPRQVVEARLAGADAVLVMLSLLDDAAAREIVGEARRLGMDALVEVHDEEEMRRALALGAPLVGINNRDLRDLSIDLATTERLAPMAADRLVVSESGIATRRDVERLAGLVDGFLVGTSLMRADDPALAARDLVFGRVKLCGLTRAEDIEAARPAAFAGFVFVPATPRFVTVEQAAPLAGAARRAGVLPVGVFRDSPIAEVADAATLLNLHAVQLHGKENDCYVDELRRQLPSAVEIWTAVSVGDEIGERPGDRTLFDNGHGGTGKPFDWLRVAGDPRLPRGILAGGIGADNARQARAIGAYAIDVGSCMDEAPGSKSPEKIAALFDALRHPSKSTVSACA